MQAPKNGFFYVLDRKTGQFISGKPFVNVTWATSLDPKTGRPIVPPEMHYESKNVTASPSAAGGAHVWQGMSFNPNTGLVYIPALEGEFQYVSAPKLTYELGIYNTGTVFRPPTTGRPAAPPVRGGSLVARDPVTQTDRWRIPMMNGGGTVTTAGNLVFAASGEGEFEALSADKGEKLWSVKLPAGFANPATFMLDGKQYVSVLTGRAGKGRMYTFALDAKEPIPPRPAISPGAPAAPAPPTIPNP
jgi:quinohemoprotein ethanol dehydrogenase